MGKETVALNQLIGYLGGHTVVVPRNFQPSLSDRFRVVVDLGDGAVAVHQDATAEQVRVLVNEVMEQDVTSIDPLDGDYTTRQLADWLGNEVLARKFMGLVSGVGMGKIQLIGGTLEDEDVASKVDQGFLYLSQDLRLVA